MAPASILETAQAVVELLMKEVTGENFSQLFEAADGPLTDEFFVVYTRANQAGYSHAALAACSYCLFKTLKSGEDALAGLYQTLVDIMKGFEQTAASLIPHSETSASPYCFVCGLYAWCVATKQVPTLEDVGQIYGEFMPQGEPAIKAFRDWCDQSIMVRMRQQDQLHLPRLQRIIRTALQNWDEPGQMLLPVQVMIGLEKWGVEIAMIHFLGNYGLDKAGKPTAAQMAPPPPPPPPPVVRNVLVQNAQTSTQATQQGPPQGLGDPFIDQQPGPTPRSARRAATQAEEDSSSEEPEEPEFAEQDDPNDGDFKP